MKKRLRKKRHLKEFAVYGAEISATWNDFNSIPEDRLFEIWDILIDHCESRNISCGGGSNTESLNVIVDPWPIKGKVVKNITNDDRDAIIAVMRGIPEFKEIVFKGWVDLWYPDRKHNYNG